MDSHVRATADGGRKIASPVNEKLIAIPDAWDSRKWFVWGISDRTMKKMNGDDELEATCVVSENSGGYVCERKIAGDDYLLGYSFESKERFPDEFEALDRQVFAEVEKLRCEK